MIVPPLVGAQTAPLANQNQFQEMSDARPALAVSAQRQAQLAESVRMTRQLAGRLARYRMDMMNYQADRALENAEIKRTTNTLAGRFSLISKVLQNLG